jgi:TRAP transporter 4TM/12TM fusion protein
LRELTGPVRLGVAVWCVVAALFQLWTAGFGFFEPREQRSIHLLLLLPIAFLLYPAHPTRSPKNRPSIIDWGLAILALAPQIYSYLEANRINLRFENVDALTPGELFNGIVATLLIAEALRRAVTPWLAGLLAVGIGYLFVTEYMPGMLNYRDMSFSEIVETMYLLNGMGMYGSITGISSTMVAAFIAFGAFIEGSGVGRLFHNLGTKVAGRTSGGPAKVEVVASCLFGTISGSSVANVFATGSFTIPAMIKLGYRRAFAAGVEASSSVGGQIMPPVMGAGAFIMAEITNIPYSRIVVAALIGALAYFIMILVSVHFEAKRLDLKGVDEKDIPTWREVLADAHLLIPVFVLLTLLLVDFSPHYAAFWSVIATVVCMGLRRHTRPSLPLIWSMLVAAGRNLIVVGLACAGAGMIVACLTVTGVIISVSNVITALAGGNVLIAGALLSVTVLILGMGVPTTAAYIIGASVGAPLLISMGLSVLQAHMFVFYYSILADATPPVSVASYAAASIARADPMRTGVIAFRLSLAGFVVGFGYLHSPALLMQGSWNEVIGQTLVIVLGLSLVAAGGSGFFRSWLNWPTRLAIVAAGLVLTLVEWHDDWARIGIIGAIMAALIAAPKLFGGERARPAARATES